MIIIMQSFLLGSNIFIWTVHMIKMNLKLYHLIKKWKEIGCIAQKSIDVCALLYLILKWIISRNVFYNLPLTNKEEKIYDKNVFNFQ